MHFPLSVQEQEEMKEQNKEKHCLYRITFSTPTAEAGKV